MRHFPQKVARRDRSQNPDDSRSLQGQVGGGVMVSSSFQDIGPGDAPVVRHDQAPFGGERCQT